jgi:hypothetical protein
MMAPRVEMDDGGPAWIEEIAVACAMAAACGVPVWPMLPRQPRSERRRDSAPPNRRSLIRRLARVRSVIEMPVPAREG